MIDNVHKVCIAVFLIGVVGMLAAILVGPNDLGRMIGIPAGIMAALGVSVPAIRELMRD